MIEIEVYLPGSNEGVSLDDYLTYLELTAGLGSWGQLALLPDYIQYSSPTTGISSEIS